MTRSVTANRHRCWIGTALMATQPSSRFTKLSPRSLARSFADRSGIALSNSSSAVTHRELNGETRTTTKDAEPTKFGTFDFRALSVSVV